MLPDPANLGIPGRARNTGLQVKRLNSANRENGLRCIEGLVYLAAQGKCVSQPYFGGSNQYQGTISNSLTVRAGGFMCSLRGDIEHFKVKALLNQ